VKVGLDRKDDEHRVAFVRKVIGDDKMLVKLDYAWPHFDKCGTASY